MAGTFKFELVSPERILLSTNAQEAVLPGADGIFTVMPGHAPVVTNLLPGIARITLVDGIKRIFVKGGFAEVGPDSVTVLAEQAFITDEVDPRQLEAELDAAQKSLNNNLDDDARMHINRAIEELRALVGNKITA
jgi:F-type H+-transporting ATPase subunit epsilon